MSDRFESESESAAPFFAVSVSLPSPLLPSELPAAEPVTDFLAFDLEASDLEPD